MKDTLNEGHLSNEDSVCCPSHIELCTNLHISEYGHLSIHDSQLGPNGVHYGEVPLYTYIRMCIYYAFILYDHLVQ